MTRLLALKVLLILAGLALLAALIPLVLSFLHPGGISAPDQMILAIYFPIGIFLLLAARNPSEHRSLIACVAWSTLAHTAVMVIQAVQGGSAREDVPALSVIGIVCIGLLALAPPKQLVPRAA